MGELDDVGDARPIEAAKTQSLFRGVNERVEELNEAFAAVVPDGEWVCECSDLSCVAPIVMSLEEYEGIRSHPNRFFVTPGHVDHAVERVVLVTDRYEVVEKLGAGAEVAAAEYPRGRSAVHVARARNDESHGRRQTRRR